MSKSQKASLIWATGISIFSLFFGSGNVVFPLTLGVETGHLVGYALLGLIVTAIGGPLLGLFGAVLYEGDCKKFFEPLGRWPAILTILLIMMLIGPFGAMPRCFIVAYSAIKSYFPELSLFAFNNIVGLLTLVLIWRRDYILPVLGYVLSPLLLISLVVIIAAALWLPGSFAMADVDKTSAFVQGFAIGYDTMDLLASIFFSLTVWMILKAQLNSNQPKDIIGIYSLSSLLGGALLALIYFGLSFGAAKHYPALVNIAPDEILSTLAINLLGPKLAIVANVAVALACLTTVMGLCVTIADVIYVDFNHKSLFKNATYSYDILIIIILAVTVVMSNLGFAKIMTILHPVMSVFYPAIIVLTLCNIFHKVSGYQFVKVPVYVTFVLSLIYQVWL